MIRSILQIILSLIAFCIIACVQIFSGCIDSIGHSRYEVKEIENRQYILTTPEDESYITIEDAIWYPEVLYDEGMIGTCELGRVYATTSAICLYSIDGNRSHPRFYFKEGIELPELSIENVNDTIMRKRYSSNFHIIVDKADAEELIELYNDTELHEVKELNNITTFLTVNMECEKYEGLYFHMGICKNENDYYINTVHEYDSISGEYIDYYIKCTSIVEDILDNE